MEKPSNWDDLPAETSGNFERPIGPQICEIVDVIEDISKASGNPMVVYDLDIADGDFIGYFRKMFERNSTKPWPCKMYRVTNEENMPRFKGDIKAIEESNTGFTFDFNLSSLVGKLVGCNFREEEYIGREDGNIHTSIKPAYLFPAKDITKQKPMKKKTINQDESHEQKPKDDSLPF